MKSPLALFALMVVALASPASSLTTNPNQSVATRHHQPTAPITSRPAAAQEQTSAATTATTPCGASSRSAFLSSSVSTAAALLLFSSTAAAGPALAAGTVDPALKGTKKDPAFETCLSQCMYDCTKPKGAEQKSRAECLPDCKQKCATTKQQLLKGNPIAAAQPQDSK